MKVLSSGVYALDDDPEPSTHIDDGLTGTETILLVEDDQMMRDLLRAALERFGYVVVAAQDGEAAIEVASQYGAPIHLVLADVVMPRMNGCDLARELRRWYPSIGVLLMSGFPDGATAARALETELAFFIEKPFSMQALAAAIRSAAEWRPRHAP